MPYTHDKINHLEAGWYIVYKDGKVITEVEMPWIKVPNKNDIQIMGLKWRHKHYEIEGKNPYIPPGETHMREIAIANGEEVQITRQSIVGRFIGYYDTDKKVITRVDLATGKFVTEEAPYDGNQADSQA